MENYSVENTKGKDRRKRAGSIAIHVYNDNQEGRVKRMGSIHSMTIQNGKLKCGQDHRKRVWTDHGVENGSWTDDHEVGIGDLRNRVWTDDHEVGIGDLANRVRTDNCGMDDGFSEDYMYIRTQELQCGQMMGTGVWMKGHRR